LDEGENKLRRDVAREEIRAASSLAVAGLARVAPVEERGPKADKNLPLLLLGSPEGVLPELSLRVMPGMDEEEADPGVAAGPAVELPPPADPNDSLSLLPERSEMSLGGSPAADMF
jgi:hypothetical protein